MKHLIIEGPDRTGKNTLIKNLTTHFSNVSIRHFRSPKGESNQEKEEYQKLSFEVEYMILDEINQMEFDLCIWNRSHIGEYVYGNIYRNSKPEKWVFIQEKKWIKNEETYLLLLTASPEFLSANDDGKSFSSTVESRKHEIARFREACALSSIKNFMELSIEKNGEYLTEEFITNKILKFLND